jgi:hypothetical protein
MVATALALIAAAVGYFLITTFVDLYPLNNVRGAKRSEQVTEAAVNAPIMLVPGVLLGLAAGLGVPVLGYIGAGVEFVIVVFGLALWWLPYLGGVAVPWATVGEVSWAELHARTYAQTVIVVPRIGDRPRPNLEHMILHALILAAAVATLLASTGL